MGYISELKLLEYDPFFLMMILVRSASFPEMELRRIGVDTTDDSSDYVFMNEKMNFEGCSLYG